MDCILLYKLKPHVILQLVTADAHFVVVVVNRIPRLRLLPC